MQYSDVLSAVFLSRPNRFIARVLLDGKEIICHVKNTGRCREILLPETKVYLTPGINPARKTPYDLIAAHKGFRLINIDSQAPNKAAEEFLRQRYENVRTEVKYGDSRIDFLAETDGVKTFIEVKGVTLEQNGVMLFPDAPTERGVKHLHELIHAVSEGYRAMLLFVIQTENTDCFMPNRKADPDFAAALANAVQAGVEVQAWECAVTPESMTIQKPVPVRL